VRRHRTATFAKRRLTKYEKRPRKSARFRCRHCRKPCTCSETSDTIVRDGRASWIARRPITSATNNQEYFLFTIFLDISFLIAPGHTQTLRLSYVHDLRTSSSFSRLDLPPRCLANLPLPICSSLPLFRRHALDTGFGPWLRPVNYKIDVRVR
jgi:hypothetical protein